MDPPTPVTQNCPCCHTEVTAVPYDVGSGPEMHCPTCDWCWGAAGQPLLPLEIPDDCPLGRPLLDAEQVVTAQAALDEPGPTGPDLWEDAETTAMPFREPAWRCPACDMVSFNPDDAEHGYCGACHDWTGGTR